MTRAFQDNPIKLDCLQTKDLRLLNFYLRALAARYINIPNPQRGYYTPPEYPLAPLSNPAQIKKEITNALAPFDRYEIENIDYDFTALEAINFIPLEQFNWLKDDPEACMYIWLNTTALDYSLGWYTNEPYLSYNAPTTHQERYQDLIDYLDHSFLKDRGVDHLSLENRNPKTKKELLESVKRYWIQAKENTPSLDWFEQSATDDDIKWTWNYIIDYNHKYLHPTTLRFQDINLPEEAVTTIEDKRLVIIAALQHWQHHHDTKNLFYQRIRRAYSQRKSRKSREDMKAVNTYIGIRAKEKLDRLSKFNRVRMNEMLEIMIEDQYERQKIELEERYGKISSRK